MILVLLLACERSPYEPCNTPGRYPAPECPCQDYATRLQAGGRDGATCRSDQRLGAVAAGDGGDDPAFLVECICERAP